MGGSYVPPNVNPGHRGPKSTAAKSEVVGPDYPAPDHLSPEAAKEWEAALIACASIRTITGADLKLPEQWSIARADFVRAAREIEQHGPVITDKDGNQKRSPWYFIQNKANDKLLRLANEFGWSPASDSQNCLA
jgi:P27 family predicted phage terminase small subunit